MARSLAPARSPGGIKVKDSKSLADSAQTEERHFFLRQTIIQGSFPRIQGSFSNLHALTPNQELNELPAPSAATATSKAILTAIHYSNSNSNVEAFETP
ncbi:hypothetical protein V1477_013567 [Vespula maculifrons]|uniref:Uncharacterized protein n=1 Tax=Vespula maculifrons TaxID=7453 RepID=A0ABD2BQH4_VESMC